MKSVQFSSVCLSQKREFFLKAWESTDQEFFFENCSAGMMCSEIVAIINWKCKSSMQLLTMQAELETICLMISWQTIQAPQLQIIWKNFIWNQCTGSAGSCFLLRWWMLNPLHLLSCSGISVSADCYSLDLDKDSFSISSFLRLEMI